MNNTVLVKKEIYGYEKEKNEMQELHDMLCNAQAFRKRGVRIPRGIILSGEPGVGKTILAKTIAGDDISVSELRAASCCDEETTERIREVFREAKENNPSVILIDELDKIAGGSMSFFMEGNDNVRKVLLQEIDSIPGESDIMLVATCNDAECLGNALLRPGRFDRHLRISMPDESTRHKIIENYFRKIDIPQTIDYGYTAKITAGFTGADIECLANESGIRAMLKDFPCIDNDDIRLTINRMIFDSDEDEKINSRDELYTVAVHEAGHALVAMMLDPDNIYGASTFAQGESSGHVSIVSGNDSPLPVRKVEDSVSIALGGHVAERVILGEYYTGSSADISKASASVTRLIMSSGIDDYRFAVARVRSNPGENLFSDELRTELDHMVEKKLLAADRKAESIIKSNMELYRAIVKELTKRRFLSREDLMEIKKAVEEKAA